MRCAVALILLVGCEAGALVGDPPAPTPPPAPVAAFTATPSSGPAPLLVTLDASASSPADARYAWTVGDGAAEGVVVEEELSTPGCYALELTVSNSAGSATADGSVLVTSGPVTEPPRVTLFERPLDRAVVPRDLDSGTAVVTVRGTLDSAGYEELILSVERDGAALETLSAPACPDGDGVPFRFDVELDAGMWSYDLTLSVRGGEDVVVAARAVDLAVGDVLLVQGQSNAVARAYGGDANGNQGPFLRSFGARSESVDQTTQQRQWVGAEGNANEGVGAIGQWALRMGRVIVEQSDVPLGIINGARGGRRIGYFQRNDVDPTDLTTNYGRLLARARWAGVAEQARAVLFYQGESDGSDAEAHVAGFEALAEDWREDYPGLEHLYAVQVREGCGDPSPALRDGQRRLPETVEDLTVMSATGLDGHDGCHFTYTDGYEALGERFGALLLRDLYGATDDPNLTAPEPASAVRDGLEVRVSMRAAGSTLTVVGDPSVDFEIEGSDAEVTAVAADGDALVLTLDADPGEGTLAYRGHRRAGPWVLNTRGVGMLTFQGLPID